MDGVVCSMACRQVTVRIDADAHDVLLWYCRLTNQRLRTLIREGLEAHAERVSVVYGLDGPPCSEAALGTWLPAPTRGQVG